MHDKINLACNILSDGTVHCKIVDKEIFKYPISGSKKYQNEFSVPKYVGVETLIINME